MPSRAGSPNKNKQALIALLKQKYPGYEPVMQMARDAFKITKLAEAAEVDSDLWMQSVSAHERVAQYTTPKRKAVEVTGEGGDSLIVKVVKHAEQPDKPPEDNAS